MMHFVKQRVLCTYIGKYTEQLFHREISLFAISVNFKQHSFSEVLLIQKHLMLIRIVKQPRLYFVVVKLYWIGPNCILLYYCIICY